jgi:hypothetical protein
MKYTKRKTKPVGSLAAAQVVAALESQNPPLGNKAAADLIGFNYETVRAVTNDNRIPSVGMIHSGAHICKMGDEWIAMMLGLRQEDLAQKKINKVISLGSKVTDIESLVMILGILPERQVEELKETALKLARAHRGIK